MTVKLSAKGKIWKMVNENISGYPPGRLPAFWIILSSLLCLFGCQAEKVREVRPAERVELLTMDQNDPRPYFHAELKFAVADKVKLPGRAEDLQKRIKVREAGSLFAREGGDFIPFKVSNRS